MVYAGFMNIAPRPRSFVQLPPELAAQIDELVGTGQRSAFLIELAQRELKRRRLLKLLQDPEPIWKAEDHPEWPNGDSNEWVRQIRAESNQRFDRVFPPADQDGPATAQTPRSAPAR